jgi:thymidine kinase
MALKPYHGSIELITGPMFSEKSSTLINRIERYLIAKKKVIALKWGGDTRYSGEPYLVTHSGLQYRCIPCDDNELKHIYPRLKDYEVICIDEGSFFKDIVSFCENLANRGHKVIVASLVGNYFRTGFNDILNLIPKCEKITMLTAVCMRCFEEGATFTQMTRKDVVRDGRELVGGPESYIAVCRKCYFQSQVECKKAV